MDQIQYYMALIWVIEVILFTLFEPILSEVKQNMLKIKFKNTKDLNLHNN